MKDWITALLFLLAMGCLPAWSQKIIQKDIDPPQRNVSHGGRISRIEYTRHKMIVHFVTSGSANSTFYGPGHPNCWRLYDKANGQEYALQYIKNIRIGKEVVVPMLDEPREEQFQNVGMLSCEAHFERPDNRAKTVHLIEEAIERYESRWHSQWPYNVYDIRVLPFKDDMRNSRPPVVAAKPGTAKPEAQKPKPTLRSPAPRPQTPDSVLARAPKTEVLKPTPDKIENLGSTVKAGRTYRLNSLLFKQSDWNLQANSYSQLDTLAAIMVRNPGMEIELAGHTDNVGDPKLNVELSRKRVETVKNYLVGKGIQASRVKTTAYGGSRPIADNAYEATRKLNRRVEVTIVKE